MLNDTIRSYGSDGGRERLYKRKRKTEYFSVEELFSLVPATLSDVIGGIEACGWSSEGDGVRRSDTVGSIPARYAQPRNNCWAGSVSQHSIITSHDIRQSSKTYKRTYV